MEISNEHIADLEMRWSKARESALNKVTFATGANGAKKKASHEIYAELDAERRHALEKQVFENSVKLGAGFSKVLGLTLETEDIVKVLSTAGERLPCLQRQTRKKHDGIALERKACDERMCDFYREAIDGLVVGLSEDVTFARHRSVGHGDEFCRDALYVERTSKLRFGDVPKEFTEPLCLLIEKFARLKLVLEVCGVSEGVVFYTLSRQGEPLCGPTSNMFHDLFKTEVSKWGQNFKTKDVSPASVFAEKDQ